MGAGIIICSLLFVLDLYTVPADMTRVPLCYKEEKDSMEVTVSLADLLILFEDIHIESTSGLLLLHYVGSNC